MPDSPVSSEGTAGPNGPTNPESKVGAFTRPGLECSMRQRLSSMPSRTLAFTVALVILGEPLRVLADKASDVAVLEAKCEAEREAKIRPLPPGSTHVFSIT
jgi:hypothetical protein